MKIAVIGASGRTGRPLVAQALDRGHEVVAFVRDAERLPTDLRDHPAVTVVEGDAYTGEGLSTVLAEPPVDAVVSVLGQSGESPDDLLTVAGERVLTTMDDAGVDRFVTLVGAGVREEGESVSLGGKVMGSLLKLLAREALEDAGRHVETVRESDTRWTVVRAPRLTDGEHTGRFRHGVDLRLGVRDVASRANVAHLILDCLEDETYVRSMPKVADQ